jgi:hypothetical protein
LRSRYQADPIDKATHSRKTRYPVHGLRDVDVWITWVIAPPEFAGR